MHRNHHPAGSALREDTPAKEATAEIAEKGHPLVDREVILIGASTGGPQTLQRMIPRLPRDFPVPIIIVQHMPATFTKSLAERLDKLSELKVYEACDGEPLQPGQVYIAPGGQHLYLKQRMGGVYLRIGDEGEDIIYKPSVNVTAESVAAVYRSDAVGIMLTGMGNDGLEGFKKMKAKQAYLMAQSRETCVIYGMPRAVIEAGIVDEILSPESMIHRLIKGNAVSRPLPGPHRTLI
ncbi:MAG: chemotaxis protein CheB [Calditrichaeota bacterium]|nr:MAG: chemotaxis protein CheB [Calditrichota bacterium]